MFTDTDSLCYEIKTDDVYKDLFQDKKKYLIIVITQKTVSSFLIKIRRKLKKMKDEAAGMPIKEFRSGIDIIIFV